MQITLSDGGIVQVDDADAPLVSSFQWHRLPGKQTSYATTSRHGKTIYMHRLIMGFPRLSVDHINCDGLDNRRGNLRLATNREQQRNSRSRRGSTSKYKGVSIHRAGNGWQAMLAFPGPDGKRRRLTKFVKSEDEAARIYNAWARERFGEYARLNVIEEGC